MSVDQSVAEAKSSSFKEYAKQFFDASVASVMARKPELQEVPAFEFPDGTYLEQLPDGSFKGTIPAKSAIDDYIQERLAELGATNDPK